LNSPTDGFKPMLSVEDRYHWTREQKSEQIAIRHNLLKQMVRSLYPAIIREEIHQIEKSINQPEKPIWADWVI